MKLATILILTALSVGHARADDRVKYSVIAPAEIDNMKMLNEIAMAGDTNKSCFLIENICYLRVRGFKAMPVRVDGRWADDVVIGKFRQSPDPANRDSASTIAEYSYLTVKNFAMDESQSYVIEVEFAYGPSTQVIYVFGDFRPGNNGTYVADMARWSDLNEDQRRTRIKLKKLENYMNAGQRDFMGELGQVGVEDMRRAEAVGNLMASWVSVMGSAVATKSTALTATASAIRDNR